MYYEIIKEAARLLGSLGVMLDKATEYAQTRKFDANNFLLMRLAPDMFPLLRQVQLACDTAKFLGARLSGKEAERHEDNETSLVELSERIRKCQAFLAGLSESDLAGAATREVALPWMEGRYLTGTDYCFQMALPNFFFHVNMVYAILRSAGVPLGKMDYLGSLNLRQKSA